MQYHRVLSRILAGSAPRAASSRGLVDSGAFHEGLLMQFQRIYAKRSDLYAVTSQLFGGPGMDSALSIFAGRPTRRKISWKRGSDRNGSKHGRVRTPGLNRSSYP